MFNILDNLKKSFISINGRPTHSQPHQLTNH